MTMTPASTLAFFASVIKSGEPWTPICQQAMDEAMAHMLRQANLTGVETMTLPQNVEDALKLMDGCISTLPDGNKRDWQTIRAHLLSQDAEVERYKVAWTEYNDRTEWVQKTAKPKELGLHRADVLRLRIESAESRLAAATAEIEQLQAGLAKHVNRVCELQSRLAAANALLREAIEWNWLDEDAPQQAGVNADIPSVMDALYLKIQTHLQGAQHDRA